MIYLKKGVDTMPYTKSAGTATIKYMRENLEEVRFRVKKGKKKAIEERAKQLGFKGVQSYLKRLIIADMGEIDL